jgi:hypothetical protein
MTKAQLAAQNQYNRVKAAFIANGQTISAWCEGNELHLQNVRKAFLGEWTGVKATQLKQRVERAVSELES